MGKQFRAYKDGIFRVNSGSTLSFAGGGTRGFPGEFW